MSFRYQLVDLTHELEGGVPTWDGGCGFKHELAGDYKEGAEYVFRTHRIEMKEGIGTHMDAPGHCVRGGRTVEELLLWELVVPVVVFDVSEKADARYRVGIKDIEEFERKYGRIQDGVVVLVRTGWERYWEDGEKYRNGHVFPDIGREAAEFLLERGVAGIGVDTLSPDRGEDGYPVHKLFLGAGKYILENVANMGLMPVVGGHLGVFPMKIKGGTEAPVRLVGFIE